MLCRRRILLLTLSSFLAFAFLLSAHASQREAAAVNRISFIAQPAKDNSLKLDPAGNPVIAFWDDPASLMLAHCANPTCSSGTSIHTVDTGQVFAEVSLALNS